MHVIRGNGPRKRDEGQGTIVRRKPFRPRDQRTTVPKGRYLAVSEPSISISAREAH